MPEWDHSATEPLSRLRRFFSLDRAFRVRVECLRRYAIGPLRRTARKLKQVRVMLHFEQRL